MAPASRIDKNATDISEDELFSVRGDRKTRKPLVEKKRRARINESIQELRLLLADMDAQTKMENAEVLEMTVRRVESIMQNRAKEAVNINREASERFAAGYIQCMHEVHTFVSTCPGVDASIAADLLNHLLESMPLNDENRFQDILADLMLDFGCANEGALALLSRGSSFSSSSSPSALSPFHSVASSDDLCSDLDDTDTEQSHILVDNAENQPDSNIPTMFDSKFMWRPW